MTMQLQVDTAQVQVERLTTTKMSCTECGEPIKKRDEMTPLGDNHFAHFWCAGTEKKLLSCDRCFMIVQSCACGASK